MLKRPCFICITLILFSCMVSAQPPQRIIVGFDSVLTEADKSQFKQEFEKILDQPLMLVKPSNEQRWVIELTPALDPQKLTAAIAAIQALTGVRYAETDSLMHIQ